jgi:creatinine amidohydrolase
LIEYIQAYPHQIEAAIQDCPLAFVPIGALEWHSYHLKLGFDGNKAEKLLHQVAKTLEKGVMFPTIYFGAYNTMKFPWTFHFSKSDFQSQLKTFVKQLIEMGFRIIIILTGHYPPEHVKFLQNLAIKMMNKFKSVSVLAIPEYDLLMDLEYFGDHAAKWETSISLALFPNDTDLTLLPDTDKYIDRAQFFGTMGEDPKIFATKELGAKIVQNFCDRLILQIQQTITTKSQDTFRQIYKNASIKTRELRSLKNLPRTLQILGMKSKSDLIAHAKWMIFKGSKMQPKPK